MLGTGHSSSRSRMRPGSFSPANRWWWRPETPQQWSLHRHDLRRTSARGLPSVDERELLRGAAQVAIPVARDHHQVLDPNAEAPGEVDPGLHRDGVALAQLVLGGGREPRALMDLESDPVAEAVPEVIAVTGLGDHLPCHGVDLL